MVPWERGILIYGYTSINGNLLLLLLMIFFVFWSSFYTTKFEFSFCKGYCPQTSGQTPRGFSDHANCKKVLLSRIG